MPWGGGAGAAGGGRGGAAAAVEAARVRRTAADPVWRFVRYAVGGWRSFIAIDAVSGSPSGSAGGVAWVRVIVCW